jgi:hypothetical protein
VLANAAPVAKIIAAIRTLTAATTWTIRRLMLILSLSTHDNWLVINERCRLPIRPPRDHLWCAARLFHTDVDITAA